MKFHVCFFMWLKFSAESALVISKLKEHNTFKSSWVVNLGLLKIVFLIESSLSKIDIDLRRKNL